MRFFNLTNGQCKHYVYQYIRVDTNTPFYIGIGTKRVYSTQYKRARDISRHKYNKIFYAITQKTKYEVYIIFESNDYNEIKNKEIELIKQYGRIAVHTGLLANLTDGGDGTINYVNPKSLKKCYAYTKEGIFYKEFDSITKAAEFFAVGVTSISMHINHKNEWLVRGYQFRKYKIDKIDAALNHNEKMPLQFGKSILQYTLDGKFLKEWQTSHQIQRELSYSRGSISDCCRGVRKQAYGFQWRFKGKEVTSAEY